MQLAEAGTRHSFQIISYKTIQHYASRNFQTIVEIQIICFIASYPNSLQSKQTFIEIHLRSLKTFYDFHVHDKMQQVQDTRL